MKLWFGNSGASATTGTHPAATAVPAAGSAAPVSAPSVPTDTATSAGIPSFHIDFTNFVPIAFTLIFGIWVIFTVIIIYHWFRYRHQSWFAVPAVALHLFVSGWIILFMVSGLH
jgi:hypothetical protein